MVRTQVPHQTEERRAKLPFSEAQDGISNTFSIIPDALGKESQVFVGDIDIDLDLNK